jgi:hypothetical protein
MMIISSTLRKGWKKDIMQSQRVNRTDAEKVYIVVKNVAATVATAGSAMRFCGGLVAAEIASTDGISAHLLTAVAQMPMLAGIAVEDIAVNGYGRVQSWGYCPTALFSFEANKTVGIVTISETYLRPGGAAGTLTSGLGPEAAMLSTNYKYIQNMGTVNISGGAPSGAVFVRAI